MADSNKIGTSYHEVEAKTDKAEADLREFRRVVNEITDEIDRDAAGVGTEFENTGRKIGQTAARAEGASKTVGGGFERAIGAATKFQSILSALLIPAALIASLKGVYDQVNAIRREAADLKKEADETIDSVGRALQQRRVDQSLSAESRVISDRLAEYREQVAAITDRMDELGEKSESVGGRFFRFMTGSQIKHQMMDLAEAAKEIQDLQAKDAEKLGQQIKRDQEEARRLALQTARDLADSIQPEDTNPVNVLDRQIQEKIDQLKEVRAGLEGDAREFVTNLIIQAYDEQERLTGELGARIRDEHAKSMREEIENIRRETLDPIENQILDTKDRINELHEELNNTPLRSEQIDLTNRLIEALGGKLDRLQKEQAQQARELPKALESAVEAGVDRALTKTGLLQVRQTLFAIQQNADLIASEIRR